MRIMKVLMMTRCGILSCSRVNAVAVVLLLLVAMAHQVTAAVLLLLVTAAVMLLLPTTAIMLLHLEMF